MFPHSSWPGLTRSSTKKTVRDTRNRPGHDGRSDCFGKDGPRAGDSLADISLFRRCYPAVIAVVPKRDFSIRSSTWVVEAGNASEQRGGRAGTSAGRFAANPLHM